MYTSRSLLSFLTNCVSLTTLVASLPTDDQRLSTSKRDSTIEQNVFFNIAGAEAESKITKFRASGYMPTSLSIHGSPTDPKYAGIWTKQDGNAYETILGANETTFEAWLAQWRASGYVSTHVSATGPASGAVFAGVMQQIPSVSSWVQKCGLDTPYAYLNATIGTPMVIKGVSTYGVPNQRRFCILGHEDTDNHQQTVWYLTDYSRTEYKTLEADETSKRFWRPVYIDSTEDRLHSSVFDDTTVGQWNALTDLTTAQLEGEVAAQKAKDMHPIHISGAGSTDARYSVIFAERVIPLQREWHTTGTVTGFQDNSGVSNALDEIMQTFMKRNSVRQAQIAASINGTVIASRAYTWAESDRAVVQPSDKFLLGSVSKAFTHAAVDDLISKGILNLTTPVYPLLGYTAPADPRSLDITVEQLLDHSAGFDRSKSPDIGFIFRDVARSLSQSSPASLRQVIEYIYARPLDFTPGERSVYSNYGTMLMSYVLTNLTGESYSTYLKDHVLAGLDVDLYATSAVQHVNDAIVQETKHVDVSALAPLSKEKVPGPNGGDGAVKEEAIASFGLRASAATVSQFIGTHAVYGIGARQQWVYRDGTVAGARAIAYSLSDIDWALTLNTREYVDEMAWEQLVYTDVRNVWERFLTAGS